MEDNKIEEMKELKEDINEAKDLSDAVNPEKPNYVLIGLGVLLGFGILFSLTKKFAKKIKAWNEDRKAKKEVKKARKDAKKHPEDYASVNEEDIEKDDSSNEAE